MSAAQVRWRAAPPAEKQTARVTAAFRAAYGYEPWAVFSAPGRVNLLGEHIDYSGGTVLPLALPHRTVVAAGRREDDVVRAVSAQEPGAPRSVRIADVAPGEVEGWLAYVAGVPWALEAEGLGPVPGADLAVDSAVPLGAGLSSSAALECSAALAFDALAAEPTPGPVPEGRPSPPGSPAGRPGMETAPSAPEAPGREPLAATDAGRARLAAACVRAENEIAGAGTGGMDQSISLRAREGSVLAIDCRDFGSRAVDIDLAGSGLALLVIDTRAPHRLVDGQYARRRQGCDEAARTLGVETLRDALGPRPDAADAERALRRWDELASSAASAESPSVRSLIRHAWTEMVRVQECVELFAGSAAAGRSAWEELGALLDASHASLRDDYRVSCPELDVAADSARAAGALGARMTGGGFGGSAIALVAADRAEEVARGVIEAFAREGFERPEFMLAAPAGPARREPLAGGAETPASPAD
ncbi:galactokinase [Rothia halotolerans]|uniref:galactokinase n=1 Tax=Rothia halotolerans TaxID=405770 RepID=UPI00101C5593|nr:galactokinase family protein [Rothia halotolerans]